MNPPTTRNPPSRKRLLIFVVAYEAEATLDSVLDRIPEAVFVAYETEILVIDDASTDRTFELGVRHSRSSRRRITVLYNPKNLGYGGNQKQGYRYAVKYGFDIVVLLHGDGQYAPERILDLVQPIAEGSSDAVLGSRMMAPGGALDGGMPLYKFVGNRILTYCQNLLLRQNLTEYHSGYRAYRVSTLGALPVEYNTNAFHFDTEIIIQLLLAGARIREVPIPTYYGNEICRVVGLRYAIEVMRATILSRFHAINLLHRRNFDVAASGNAFYDLKLGYPSSHTIALAAVPSGSRVLDIGCGPGLFALELKAKGCAVTGMDRHRPEHPEAFEEFRHWHADSGTSHFNKPLEPYDSVLLLDIIEHMTDPEGFLDEMRRYLGRLGKAPQILITSGNVAFCVVRAQLLLGNFNYGKRGILDLTHTRLYTFDTLRKLLEQCGYVVTKELGIPAPFPKVLGKGPLGRLLLWGNNALISLSKGLFAYQIFMIATPQPTVDALLEESVIQSEVRGERISELDEIRSDPQ
jgi:glycosyltransferase involved in cell wall biosynthesis